MGTQNHHKKRNRRTDIVSSETVEELRNKIALQKNEMAILMGLSDTQYRRCEIKGGFLAFRFYAAIDAVELSAIKKANKTIKEFAELRSGLKIEDIQEL